MSSDASAAVYATACDPLDVRVHRPPATLPVRLLLQRLDADRPASAHLDVACSDVDAVCAWHREHGASVVARRDRWTVMRDPAGGVYCLTARDPDTGTVPDRVRGRV